ncbi:MAG: dipeptidase [Nocardioides sp.]|nr:dipeptidase [Nocardioides sp.]
MSAPRVTGVPVDEREDDPAPLVDATGFHPRLGVDDREDDGSGARPHRHLRRPVLERLADAADALPGDLRLVLVEGWRRPSLQRTIFERYRDELGAADPARTAEELHHLAARHISPPEVAPHPAGTAVDVLLTTPEGIELDVACPINATPEESGGRCYTDHPDVGGEARLLRVELGRALAGAGFVNYPTEWWHWSYGDRYWARATGAPHARYGTVLDLPE